jgi:phospholipase C
MVSWIIPDFNSSEHPENPPWDGAVLISQGLEALLAGQAPNWGSTVLIVTYDESDGHFDHVPPPQPDPNNDPEEFINGASIGAGILSIGAGFWVPTFVISPWTIGRGICSDPYFTAPTEEDVALATSSMVSPHTLSIVSTSRWFSGRGATSSAKEGRRPDGLSPALASSSTPAATSRLPMRRRAR